MTADDLRRYHEMQLDGTSQRIADLTRARELYAAVLRIAEEKQATKAGRSVR